MLILHPQKEKFVYGTLSVQIALILGEAEEFFGVKKPKIPYIPQDLSQLFTATNLIDRNTTPVFHTY